MAAAGVGATTLVAPGIGRAAFLDVGLLPAVRPIAAAYFRYVSTEAMTTRASTDRIWIPTSETVAHASITMPLSRMMLITSARLEESVDFWMFAIAASLGVPRLRGPSWTRNVQPRQLCPCLPSRITGASDMF